MTKVTVIIPAKVRSEQEADWLRVAIKSVPEKYPIVLVNDHSVVEWGLVEKEIPDRPGLLVKHLTGKRKGLAAARNYSMESVKTEFFFPLDADDYLAANAIDIALGAYPGDGFLYGSTILFDDKQRSTYLAREYDFSRLMQAVYWPNGCLQRTENWKRLGGWDETLTLYEDWDYWLRSGKVGICGHSIPDVLYCYRRNPQGMIETIKRNPAMATNARRIIEERHADIYARGEFPMGCCGKRTRPTISPVPATPQVQSNVPLPAAEGMTVLRYVGGSLSVRTYYGESGMRYRFGGKQVRGYVANPDVRGLLAMTDHGRAEFQVD
jgi:hypothetical protein